MVLDILQWTYRKFKVYCFIAYILLAVCLLGYTALIIYWFKNMMQESKVRKKYPPPPPPEQLTASPSRARTAKPDKIMALDDQPVPKVRVPKPSRHPSRLEEEQASLTPSPLNKRSLRRERRRRRTSRRIYDDDESYEGRELPHYSRRLKLRHLGTPPTSQPTHKGVSDRLKDSRPTQKQYLFV